MAGQFSPIKAPVKIVHSNLEQEVIVITEDRLRLILNNHIELVEERKSWIAPLGLVLAIISVFVTADFRDFYFKAAVWEAVFFISGVLSSLWLVRTLIRAGRAPSLDEVVVKIKAGSGG